MILVSYNKVKLWLGDVVKKKGRKKSLPRKQRQPLLIQDEDSSCHWDQIITQPSISNHHHHLNLYHQPASQAFINKTENNPCHSTARNKSKCNYKNNSSQSNRTITSSMKSSNCSNSSNLNSLVKEAQCYHRHPGVLLLRQDCPYPVFPSSNESRTQRQRLQQRRSQHLCNRSNQSL